VAIIAELIGGGAGIGQRILLAENAGPDAYPIMYAYIVVAGILGVLLAGAFAIAERYALHWHESQRSAGDELRPLETAEVTLASVLPAIDRAGADPGLGVRGHPRGLVDVVGELQVAVLPAA